MTAPIDRRSVVAALAATALLPALPARAEPPSSLVDAARKEATVTWYSGLIVNQVVRPVVEGFERKYKGIKVQAARIPSPEAVLKILNEARAGKPQASVFDGTAVVHHLVAANVVEPYAPQAAANYPPAARDPANHWTALNTYIMTPAINTELVPEAEAPKTLQDLLDPKWQGRIAWTNDLTTAGPPGFIGNVLLSMGEAPGMEYLKRLATQRIVNVPASQRVVLDQVIGGQYPLALMTFDNHSVISAKDGAPCRFLPISPAVQVPNPIGLIRGAPSPNAGKLLIEYALGEEGQTVFRNADYLPANPAILPKDPTLLPEAGHFTTTIIPPELAAQKLDSWIAIYNQLFK